jgi:hypothetical protein
MRCCSVTNSIIFLVIRYTLRRQHHFPLMSQNLENLISLTLCVYGSLTAFSLCRMKFAATVNCVESPVEPASKSVKLHSKLRDHTSSSKIDPKAKTHKMKRFISITSYFVDGKLLKTSKRSPKHRDFAWIQTDLYQRWRHQSQIPNVIFKYIYIY